MADLKISGNPNPIVGQAEKYSIDGVLGNSSLEQAILSQKHSTSPFDNQIKWTVHILEKGTWRKAISPDNDKTGATVTYTFFQQSLTRDGIRLKVEVNGKSATIDIKTQKAPDAKIVKVELLNDKFQKPTKPFAYGDSIIASVHCVKMEMLPVKVTLWEDDMPKAGHNAANSKVQYGKGNVLNGRVYVKFFLGPNAAKIANLKVAPGKEAEGEGEMHEYYVTAEIFEKNPTRIASANTNVKNPDYQPEAKKQTPAQQKGPSKKEEKGIFDSAGGVLQDYYETSVSVLNEIGENIREKINSLMTVDMGDNKGNENGPCVCKEYDLIWGNKVSCDFRKKVVEISKSLWPDKYKSMANGLMAVMRVETSETFSPSKIDLVSYVDDKGKKRKKYAGLSKEAINKLDDNFAGAVGLIQFTKDAIDALNKENSLTLTKKKLALMSDIDQLDYVKKYFMLYNWHKKLLSPEDIYLQVFAPIGIAKDEDYVLYKKHENPQTNKEKVSTKNYNANKSVDEENNNDKKIQRSEILGRYRTSFAEGLSKKEKEFSCGASKEKEESSDIGVLEEMKVLVDKHIPYSQLGVRNSLSEKGLEGLDCSETVSIYLTKLGITPSVKEINTGIMTTQEDFRRAINSENIDFVSGSDSDDFKPKRGDIFVWRRSDGIGHTGIVYEFNEKTDLVTILEAIGNVGSADENTNNINGGYSGKGSSRTAVYKRTGKALANHKGWKGYFRPKNYSKKL